MKIDYRSGNSIKTQIPLDYKEYLKRKEDKQQQQQQQQQSTQPTGAITYKRKDRLDEQFRQIFMKTGIVTQASGSCYLEIEKTKVLCSVYGPRATPKTELFETAKLNCELKYATFSSNKEKFDYLENTKEKDQSLIIYQSIIGSLRLDKYPKTVVDVYILVLNDDGDVLVSAITAASMALADAGVEMYDMVASCSAVCIKDATLINPTAQEETLTEGAGKILVSKMPSHNNITQLIQTGELNYNNVLESVNLCIDGSDKIYSIMKQNLIDSLLRQQKKDGDGNEINGITTNAADDQMEE
ncbi:hypothetical protein CYY_004752 [Polysphondylium violaceum]|uniref:Exoribonuclease phosphorolytic domain-containing protein n=1 Tax=Polysphondylium violaceum TaxID=133409 RepID=A0A8J4PU39_9MYCE|nr:hypothetical protein CYY_004752 [Polysphondylium violaceum]